MVEATRERINVTADRLYETVRRLIHEGNELEIEREPQGGP